MKMPILLFCNFLEINSSTLIEVMFIFIIMLALLSVCTIVFFIHKSRLDKSKKLWQQDITLMISNAVFYEGDDHDFDNVITPNKKLLRNITFRQSVIDELIHTRKELSGSSAFNIKRLYEILVLNNDSFKKLHNKKWHIKAKGIQELSIMEQAAYAKEIFHFVNNKNELVRNEAQCALVDFNGFAGLDFLNVTAYTISEWQQIQLLNKLQGVTPNNFEVIKKWLQSPNESVVNFSLRLAAFYNRFDVYPDVMDCLPNTSLKVKLNTLNYLKKIPQEGTAEKIVKDYSFENKTYQLAIINALNDIGNENQIIFLLKQLMHQDDDIKAAAAKSLSNLHPGGISFLKTHLFADEYPWKTIFLQIENEHAA